MIATERLYPIRRPLAALFAGASVALLGGLIGLGGAEFRLPLLIAVFALYPHRAIRINLLISLATLATSAAARVEFLGAADVSSLGVEIVSMLIGGMVAAWIGAGFLRRIPKARIMGLIALLLAATAGLLAAEALLSGVNWSALPQDPALRAVAGLAAGLLGVAGGEFIIPILIFLFGVDIKTAGTASVLISVPIVLTGVVRHWLTGHYRSQSMLLYLVLPMSVGSLLGAAAGSYLAVWAPTDTLRLTLAVILAATAFKLWAKDH
jgi:uncharacterized membrane protein YfcA